MEQGTVRYEDTMVTIAFSTVGDGGIVDVAAAAFMTGGPRGADLTAPGRGRLAHDDVRRPSDRGRRGRHRRDRDRRRPARCRGRITGIDDRGGPRLRGHHRQPRSDARHPSRRRREPTARSIAADGSSTSTRRWTDTRATQVDAAWGGSGDCAPPSRKDCPLAHIFSGPSTPPGFEVFVPRVVDDLTVLLDGQPAEATIEHAQGFTFAYGPAPSVDATLEVTVDGQPAC